MTLDEFERSLQTSQQRLLDLTPILEAVGQEMTAELRLAAPGFGPLKASIRFTVQPNQFGITMLDYGAFQNYGVKSARPTSAKYTNQIKPAGNFTIGGQTANQYFQFGTGNYSRGGRPWGAYYTGLGPHVGWYDPDGDLSQVTRRVVQKLQQRINQAFE